MATTFTDSFSEEIWKTTYKDHTDNSIDDTFKRVALALASVEDTEELRIEWEEKFSDMLTDFKVVPGGRILANAGTEFGAKGTSLANCFVGPKSHTDVDSIAGIYTELVNQAQTLKSEGGWGNNFSHLRPRGTFINGIGVDSPGAVKFMELFDKSSEIITSGSGQKSTNKKAKGKIRKGAQMAVLDCTHPDIIEFINAKQTPGRLTKFNMSVNCSDAFMNKVLAVNELYSNNKTPTDSDLALVDSWDLKFPDTTFEKYTAEWNGNLDAWEAKGYPVVIHNTVSATWLWDMIMKSTYNRAEPGVLWMDRANYFNPLNYQELIQATNPSMPKGTLVHTRDGIFPIDELEGKSFYVKSRDGSWAKADCTLSGTNEQLVKIEYGNLKCVYSTKEHRWPVYDQRMERVYKVNADNLKANDLIPMNRNEEIGIYGDMSLTQDEGFFAGYFLGDGWFSKRTNGSGYAMGITFGKSELPEAIRILSILNGMKKHPSTIKESSCGYDIQFTCNQMVERLIHRYGFSPNEKRIPDSVWKSNDMFIKGFVDGLLSADGCVESCDQRRRITLTTSRKDLAVDFAKLLSFAGIKAAISNSETQNASFPNGKKYDRTYYRYDVSIRGSQLTKFINVFDISHTTKKLKLAQLSTFCTDVGHRYHQDCDFNRIRSVELTNRFEPVWDISVHHNEHVFPTEWGYTGNCGEQFLAPGSICTLSSINLTQFINKSNSDINYSTLKKYVTYLVRFLDNVNTYSLAPLPEYKDSMMKKRRIGIGILGYGSLLFMLKVRYGSDEADKLRTKFMKLISRTAYEASIDLAIEKGMFEYCNPEKHADAEFIKILDLSDEYISKLRTTGIRNSALLSVQPNGNTSILANVVSGGLEPIFMAEYVRTVIVTETPDGMVATTPKWQEGEFVETSLFKFVNEGDEQILKCNFEGVVYKIDKNRGLTKEVLCEDYGVRQLRERNEWDSKADWASTTTNLTPDEHIRELLGFAKYVDSACSKTINLPNDYLYDDFKTLYLDAYNTGYIKGLTTYRTGTMTTVLAAKDEGITPDEEIILDDVQLPTSAPAMMKTIKAEGKKWYLTVVLDESQTRPFALFVTTNSHEKSVTTDDGVQRLLELAHTKGVPIKYIDAMITKCSSDSNSSKIARTISLLLRHGVLIKSIVATLDQMDTIFVGSFLFQIKKFLGSYIKDGEKHDEACSECGGQMVFSEGCVKCQQCGSSKCG